MTDPALHLNGVRDRKHFEWTRDRIRDHQVKSLLDIGCWDGWLDFLLLREFSELRITAVELNPDLAAMANQYAKENGLTSRYECLCGPIMTVPLGDREWDAAMAYEVLEHIALGEFQFCLGRIESRVNRVYVSLPDQRYEDNPEHLWTPTPDLCYKVWGKRPGYCLERSHYSGTQIPDNFLISYRVDK